MTVVKVQRPLGGAPLWLVYDKFKARLNQLETSELPKSIVHLFNSAPSHTRNWSVQYFDGATWVQDTQSWDLSQVSPITRRLIW